MLSDKIKDYLNEYISQEVYVQVAVAKGKNKIATNAAISKYFESNHFTGLAEGKPYNSFLNAHKLLQQKIKYFIETWRKIIIFNLTILVLIYLHMQCEEVFFWIVL